MATADASDAQNQFSSGLDLNTFVQLAMTGDGIAGDNRRVADADQRASVRLPITLMIIS